MKAFKLLRRRADGSLGPLFINRRQHIPIGEWLEAETHPTKGYAVRTGWHLTPDPHAPHLRQDGDRVWAEAEVEDVTHFDRPACQGGRWLLAQRMKLLRLLDADEVARLQANINRTGQQPE